MSPELAAVMTAARERRSAGPAPSTVVEMKAMMQNLPSIPPPPGALVEPIDAGGVPAEWVRMPGVSKDLALLYFHGGGYCLGAIADRREFAARLSAASGASVLNLEYRLAPEAPFPAAFDDALAAYRWLLDSGYVAGQVVLGGDSAGGGLALALAIALRDHGLAMPAAIVALSPWTDLTMSGVSMETRAATDTLSSGVLTMLAEAYAAGADRSDPRMSPLFGDPQGLPPTLIMVGTIEVLYDDSARFASKAIESEVTVQFDPWPEVPHVWPTLPGSVPEAASATERAGAFVKTFVPVRKAAAV